MKLILGNITFHHFTEDENELFNDSTKERKALVHEIVCIVECKDEDEAGELGEGALGDCCESYLILDVFNGEIAYECSNDILPISVEDYKKDYINLVD